MDRIGILVFAGETFIQCPLTTDSKVLLSLIKDIKIVNKEYDGTVTAPLDTSSISYSGLVEGDDFTGSYSGVFANANVGNGKAVTITSSYSGADAGNYSVTDQSSTTGNIVPKVLTATASASNKTYDGGTTASECAVLGVPSIYFSSITTGYLIEEEERYDLLYRFTGETGTFKKALNKAKKILNDNNSEKKWQNKKEKMLKDKVDGTEFLINYVESNFLKL